MSRYPAPKGGILVHKAGQVCPAKGDRIAPRIENKNLEKNMGASARRICLMKGNPAFPTINTNQYSFQGVSVSFGIGMTGPPEWTCHLWNAFCHPFVTVST